jgi:acyl-CoA thioesterase-1
MNCLIIADSLAAERPDNINNDKRWPILLLNNSKSKVRLINLAKGFSTSKRLKKVSTQNLNDSDVAIIQLGIVDCTPRIFHKIETQLIARIPKVIRNKIIKITKKYRKRSKTRSYVSLSDFEKNFTFFIKKFKKKIIIIKILGASTKFNEMNPMAFESIKDYNHVLDSLNNIYDNIYFVEIPVDKIDCYTLNDGYHLNEIGHNYISNKLISLIND